MLDETYLLHGINALSRACETDYFADGHRGGAILSGCFFCREMEVEPAIGQLIAAQIDRQWAATGWYQPFPAEPVRADLHQLLLDCIKANSAGLRQAGHNIILPALALKALGELPAALTATRVAGLCRLVDAFTITEIPQAPDVQVPAVADTIPFAEFALAEFVDCTERFIGRGQGWSGHLLTYSRAMLDLQALGYAELVRAAREGYETYIRRIRLGPLDTDAVHEEHSVMEDHPMQLQYWERKRGDWGLGHVLKYPYGLYGLLEHCGDETLFRRCQAAAFRIC